MRRKDVRLLAPVKKVLDKRKKEIKSARKKKRRRERSRRNQIKWQRNYRQMNHPHKEKWKALRLIARAGLLDSPQVMEILNKSGWDTSRRIMEALRRAGMAIRVRTEGGKSRWRITNKGMKQIESPIFASVIRQTEVEKSILFADAVYKFIGDKETTGLVDMRCDHSVNGLRYRLVYCIGGKVNAVVVVESPKLIETAEPHLLISEKIPDSLGENTLWVRTSEIMKYGPYEPIWVSAGRNYRVGLGVLGFRGKYGGPLIGKFEWTKNLESL